MAGNLRPKLVPIEDWKDLGPDVILAIIYCRVSSSGQTGLGSQEYRCNQYTESKSYRVVATFYDDVTGGGDFMNRRGMVELLRFMDTYPNRRFVVVSDDLKRYARDTEFHLRLRRLMMERGARRECLNFNFDDSPEGKFTETINAAVGELDRQQNARQNRQKSIARLEQGYAVFNQLPVGYKYVKAQTGNNKVAIRDEPLASIVQEALEGYASGRFSTQVEVKRFLELQPEFPKDVADGTIRQEKVFRMLKRPMYAGYVSAPKWGIPIRDGKHEGLISKATFEVIQKRLEGGVYAPARKDIHHDFPLRGAVACSECNTPLTAGWCKGKYKKYPYYFCRTKECSEKNKTIPKGVLESAFEDLLETMQPDKSVFNVAVTMFRDGWNLMQDQVFSNAKTFKDDVKKTEKQIEQLIERTLDATNSRVIGAYEKRIDDLERKKLILAEKASNTSKSVHSFDEMFELSLQFLANPYRIWSSGRFTFKRLVLKMAFSEPLTYSRKERRLNSIFSIPFSMLGGFCASSCEMVPLGRIELPASPLPMVRSTTELQRPEGVGQGI